MDDFLSQMQPYLEQAQTIAGQLFEAGKENPYITAGFAAAFLMLVLLRRRRRRRAAQARMQQASMAAPEATTPEAATDTLAETAPEAPAAQQDAPKDSPAPRRVKAPKPKLAPARAAEPAARPAPRVLESSERSDQQPAAQSPAPKPAPASTPAAKPAPAPQAAAAAQPGPKVIHVLRRITRAADTGHSVEIDLPLSKFISAEGLSEADLAKTVDFAVVAPDGDITAVIADHTDTPKGAEPSRDPALREILRQAGYPVTELLAGFTEAQLKTHLNKLMGAA